MTDDPRVKEQVRQLARTISRIDDRVSALGRSRQLESSSVPVTVDDGDGPVTMDMPIGVGITQGVQSSFDSKFAKELSQQLQQELGEAQAEIEQSLAEAAAALAEAGLARSEAAAAVADAQQAIADSGQAVNDALEAAQLARGATSWEFRAPNAGDAAGKPLGAVWYQMDASGVIALWELRTIGWVSRPFMEAMIPSIQIGSGTYGQLAGDRIVARSILADRIQALSITAGELAANAVTVTKLAANAVTTVKLAAGAVTTEKLWALAVTAEKLAAGSVIADKIAAGAITAEKIAATAIDGMTITGAHIRTAPSGQRLEMDVDGLRAYGPAGNIVGALAADTGGFGVDGGIRVFDPTRSNVLSGLFGAEFMSVISRSGVTEQLKISPNYASPDLGFVISSGTISPITARPLYITASKIHLEGLVEFQGDTDWASVLVPGNTGAGLKWRRQAGVIYMQFDVTFTTQVGAGGVKDPMAALPTAAYPPGDWAMNIAGQGSRPASGFVQGGTGNVVFRNNHTAAIARFFGSAQWPAMS